MNKMIIKQAVLLGCVGLGLAGCSRGPLTSSATTTSGGTVVAASGKVADGYVSGATVTLDQNDNGTCESTEAHTTTDQYGNYSFSASLGSHMVCSTGGTDIATGQPETGTLYAPPGATTVNPLTALVVAQLKASGTPITAANAAAAATTLATHLGLPAGTDVLNDDPAKVVNGTPSNAALESATAAVATLLTQVTNAVSAVASGNGGTASSSTLYAHALSSLATQLNSTTTSASTLGSLAQTLVQNTVTAAQSDSTISGLGTLNATGIAAVAGPSIATSTNTVGAASASSLLTASSGNPATVAQTSTTLDTLLTNNATNLTSSTVTAASVIGNNSTYITAITANGTAVSGTLNLTANPVTTLSMAGHLPLTDITMTFFAPSGKATTGTASTAATTNGTPISVGSPAVSTEVDSAVTINIAPQTTTTSKQFLKLALDHALLYQVTGGAICGDVPSSATLTVSGSTSGGTAVSATLSGTTAAGIVNFNSCNGSVTLNISQLITDLGASSSQFATLGAIANGTGANTNYLVTTIVPGLVISDNQSTPSISDSFGVGFAL